MFSSTEYLIDASLLWDDIKMFVQQIQMLFNELQRLSFRLTELSSQLPENLKKLFKWIELSPGEILCLEQLKRRFAECSAWTKNGKIKACIGGYRTFGTLCCTIGSHMSFASSKRIKWTFEISFCQFVETFFSSFYSFNCRNSAFCEPKLRNTIKNQVPPINTHEAMELLEEFIILNNGIEPNESSVQTMSVLLARIYVTSIEVNNPTIYDNCMSCQCPEPIQETYQGTLEKMQTSFMKWKVKSNNQDSRRKDFCSDYRKKITNSHTSGLSFKIAKMFWVVLVSWRKLKLVKFNIFPNFCQHLPRKLGPDYKFQHLLFR